MNRFVLWIFVITQFFVFSPPFIAQCEAQINSKSATCKKAVTTKKTTNNKQTVFEKLLAKAKAGDAAAQYRVARHYLPNTKSVSEEGLKWLTMAAENGNADAQLHLACTYIGAYGGSNNEGKYVYWLAECANNQDISNCKNTIQLAQYELGEIYFKGKYGKEKDLYKYKKWMKKSAYNDYANAAQHLGIYYKGEKDNEEAIYWFKKTMDLRWEDKNEEDEYAAEQLKELGVRYHPGDNYASNRRPGTSTPTNSVTHVTATSVYPMSMNGDPTPYNSSSQNNYNNTYNNTSNSNTSHTQPSRQFKCAYCNGVGRIEKNDNAPATFGTNKPRQRCNECGTWYDPTVFTHYHQQCSHCGGTGYAK